MQKNSGVLLVVVKYDQRQLCQCQMTQFQEQEDITLQVIYYNSSYI